MTKPGPPSWWRVALRGGRSRWYFELTQRLNRNPGDTRAEAQLRALLDAPQGSVRRDGTWVASELVEPSQWVWDRTLRMLDEPDVGDHWWEIQMVCCDVERADFATIERCRDVAAAIAARWSEDGEPDGVATAIADDFTTELARRSTTTGDGGGADAG